MTLSDEAKKLTPLDELREYAESLPDDMYTDRFNLEFTLVEKRWDLGYRHKITDKEISDLADEYLKKNPLIESAAEAPTLEAPETPAIDAPEQEFSSKITPENKALQEKWLANFLTKQRKKQAEAAEASEQRPVEEGRGETTPETPPIPDSDSSTSKMASIAAALQERAALWDHEQRLEEDDEDEEESDEMTPETPATTVLATPINDVTSNTADEALQDLGEPMNFTPVREFIKKLLPQGFCIKSGYTGVGKTALAFNMVDALGHGTGLLGYEATGKYKCLYLSLERGEEWLGEYIKLVWPDGTETRPKGSKVCSTPKWTDTEYTSKSGDKLCGPIAWLVEKIETHGFDVVFLDNLDEFKRHCRKTTATMYHDLAELCVTYRIAIVGLTAADKATKRGSKAKAEDVGTATRKINLRMRGSNAAEVTLEGCGLAQPEKFIAERNNGRWIRREWTAEEGATPRHTPESLKRDQKLMMLKGYAATLGRKPTSTEAVKALGFIQGPCYENGPILDLFGPSMARNGPSRIAQV